jgi:hypothetical protein
MNSLLAYSNLLWEMHEMVIMNFQCLFWQHLVYNNLHQQIIQF